MEAKLYPPASRETTVEMWAHVARAASRHRDVARQDKLEGSRDPWPQTPGAARAYGYLESRIRVAKKAGVEEAEILDALLAGDRNEFSAEQALAIIRRASTTVIVPEHGPEHA